MEHLFNEWLNHHIILVLKLKWTYVTFPFKICVPYKQIVPYKSKLIIYSFSKLNNITTAVPLSLISQTMVDLVISEHSVSLVDLLILEI